jgi:putative toxin-antitoxin system antitoxin component (TIGR02293 family)
MKAKTYKQQQDNLSKVNEAMVAYAKKVDTISGFEGVEKDFNYSDFFENKMLIIHTIRKGLPYYLFSKIQSTTPFTEEDWAAYLNISTKTLQRNRNTPNFLFKPIHTEKIIELAEVTHFGKDVFDSTQQFYLWLNTPSFALGKLTPAELLKDSYGKDLVMAELNRIEHGIFA